MSAALPLNNAGACCSTSCADTTTAQVPGPPGNDGTNGTNGSNGSNAYTLTTAGFTMPAVSSDVTIAVVDSLWCVPGEVIFVQFAGYFLCDSVPNSTHVQIKNLGYTGNAAPAAAIAGSAGVTPGGRKGTDGSAGSSTLNDLSPTTTKGDLIADNGANNPNASDVRFPVGANGKALVADSSQPTGLNYATITPNTVNGTNVIPRFSASSGTPVPLKDSLLLIDNTGGINSSPTGGNARGTSAIDLQVVRLANTQVASGNNSTIAGGKANTASGLQSSVAGGVLNTASGQSSCVSAGSGNTASGLVACVAGGNGNTASAQSAFVGAGDTNAATAQNATVTGGASNTASGDNASIVGGTGNTASGANSAVSGGSNALADKYGQVTHASGKFAATGDAQHSDLIYRNNTTDATPTELFLDGNALRATVPVNTTWGGVITIVGRSSAGVCAVWEVKFGIQNNANTVTLVSAVSVAMISDGTGGSWGIVGNAVVSADNTNKSLKILMTGFAATNIRFAAHAQFTEVAY